MATNKKNNKECTVSVRFNKKEYKYIEQKKKKFGVSKSEYIRSKCLDENPTLGKVECEYIRAIVQEICNYLEEKYDGDERIESWCDEIWNL